MELQPKDLARFWAKVGVGEPEDCWVWKGSLRGGYGIFGISTAGKRKMLSAHRVSYELKNGPTDLFVLHSCDNPPCVNPKHLFAGTHTDNMLDMLQKNRGQSGLTNDIVAQSRHQARRGMNLYDIAESHSVPPGPLLYAIRGKTFKHVDEPPVLDVNIDKPRKVVKLSHQDVAEILEHLKTPYWGQVKWLAAKYGVDHSLISQIKTGRFLPVGYPGVSSSEKD